MRYALALLAACEFPRPPVVDGGAIAADAAITDGTAIDMEIDAPPEPTGPRCDPAKPFAVPAAMSALNVHARDFNGRLSANELEMYYTCGQDLCRSTRTSRFAPFTTSQTINGLNTGSEENAPSLTADGLTIYFTSTRPGGVGMGDIYVAHRATATSAWDPATLVPSINTTGFDYDPYVTPDGARLYWWAQGVAVGQFSASTSTWVKTPVAYAGTAFAGNIVVSPDQLTAYVAGTTGNVNTFQVKRTAPTQAFGPPTSLPALDSTVLDAPSWISADDCVLYLFRGSAVQPDIFTLFVAARPL